MGIFVTALATLSGASSCPLLFVGVPDVLRFGQLYRDEGRCVGARQFRSLGRAGVFAVVQSGVIFPMQQRLLHGHVANVGRSTDRVRDQIGKLIHTDMCLHAEVPRIVSTGLAHLRITLLFSGVGGPACVDDRGIRGVRTRRIWALWARCALTDSGV